MAVDGGTVGQAIGAGESSRALPLGEGFVNGGVGWMLANTALNAMVGGVRAVAAVGRLAYLRGGERVAFAHVLHRARSIDIHVYYNMEDTPRSRGKSKICMFDADKQIRIRIFTRISSVIYLAMFRFIRR